jgi:flagellar FliL protein
MADEQKEKEPKKKGKGEEGAEAEAKPKRKLPVKLIALVCGVLLLGGGGFFAYKKFFAAGHGEEAAASTGQAAGGEGEGEGGQTYRLEQFIVNLVDPLGRRYLKVKIELEMDKPEAVEEAGKRDAQIRDSVITLLTSKSYGDIDSPEGKLQLRQEIVARANQFLRRGRAVNAYFTDFVIQ